MLPKTKDVLDLLEEIAPARLAETWDNPGLQVGSYSQEIMKIFMALDPTLKALRSASEHHAQLLLTHHPLIFAPLSQLDTNVYPGNVISETVKRGISIVAAHTNLDVAAGGINDILSELLGLQHAEVLEETAGMDGVGLGRIGELPKPKTLLSIINDIQRIFGSEKLRLVAHQDIRIHRIAVVGGSGGGLVARAFEKGADLLITGDIGHHHALMAESLGIALIDAGHFHTEKTAFSSFAERLRGMAADLGWEVVVETHKDETDPMCDLMKCG
ncbi:MAG: Nif3-like dinuclear metal center hexameric protein [Deltaproteobacteria bacterium]|nr:Nif3-like dinuclear metal center hexameric protein [Deltaproteobacteria bacterium]